MGSTIPLPHRHDFLKVPTTGIVSNSSKHLFFFLMGIRELFSGFYIYRYIGKRPHLPPLVLSRL